MNIRTALLIGVAALIIGAIGPWATALGVISIGPTASTEWSVVVFGGIAVIAFSAISLRASRALSIIVGVLAMTEAIVALVRIQQAKSDAGEFGNLFQPGWGLYLTILAGAYLIASTFIVQRMSKPVIVATEMQSSVPPPSSN